MINQIPMNRLDSFTYLDDDDKPQTVDLTVAQGAKCGTDLVGIHYAPLAGVTNDPIFVMIPWNRVINVFYRP